MNKFVYLLALAAIGLACTVISWGSTTVVLSFFN